MCRNVFPHGHGEGRGGGGGAIMFPNRWWLSGGHAAALPSPPGSSCSGPHFGPLSSRLRPQLITSTSSSSSSSILPLFFYSPPSPFLSTLFISNIFHYYCCV